GQKLRDSHPEYTCSGSAETGHMSWDHQKVSFLPNLVGSHSENPCPSHLLLAG
ncbi:hypothetical protein AVEN_25132-1, partial [Araneus ventricosus]